MKRVFEFICKNRQLITVIIFLTIVISSCTVSKGICPAYAYNNMENNKDN